MVNFGFEDYDLVTSVGTNAKMSEVSAAMGLTSLESEEEFALWNSEIWKTYKECLTDVPGLMLYEYPADDRNSHQYVVVTVSPDCPLSRDAIVAVLHAERCLVRRYFYPGVHRMRPYASLFPMASRWLPHTEELTKRVLVMPTGTAVNPTTVVDICNLVREATDSAEAVSLALGVRTRRG
jgi:dTDP-4-amino-4,6-dideoxygalactose transaminase